MLKLYASIGLGVVALCVCMFAVGFFVGVHTERSRVMSKAASDRITILQDGKKVDEEVFSADDSGLCVLLGGC